MTTTFEPSWEISLSDYLNQNISTQSLKVSTVSLGFARMFCRKIYCQFYQLNENCEHLRLAFCLQIQISVAHIRERTYSVIWFLQSFLAYSQSSSSTLSHVHLRVLTASQNIVMTKPRNFLRRRTRSANAQQNPLAPSQTLINSGPSSFD